MPNREVLEHYGIEREKIRSINPAGKVGNPIIKIWFVEEHETNNVYVLKVVKPKHKWFPIKLQHLLNKKGFGAPAVYKTKKDELYVEKEEGCYFLSEYIEPAGKLSTIQRVKALADFHQLARFSELKEMEEKIQFPTVDEFKASYRDKLRDMQGWHSSLKNEHVKAGLEEMIMQAEESIKRIEACDINSYINQVKERNNICHGDYNARNSYLNKEGEIMVIDYDRAYYGLPMDDFRYLVYSLSNRSEHVEKLDFLFDNYFNFCPEDEAYESLYAADTIFPHRIHKEITRYLKTKKLKKLEKEETVLEGLTNWIESEIRKREYVLQRYSES